ncbi:hypothetical protein OIV83_001472 [Microbotryomycetes sp. JL201]|nr:hypothetical protein OIV83_001472 [Microbotryomycetes sp. JL201]
MPAIGRAGTAFDRREQQELEKVLALSAAHVCDSQPPPALFVRPLGASSLHGTLPPTDDSCSRGQHTLEVFLSAASDGTNSASAARRTSSARSLNNTSSSAHVPAQQSASSASASNILVHNSLSTTTAGSDVVSAQHADEPPATTQALVPVLASNTGLTLSDIGSFSSPLLVKAKQDAIGPTDMSTIEDSGTIAVDEVHIGDSEDERSGGGSMPFDPFLNGDDQADSPPSAAAASAIAAQLLHASPREAPQTIAQGSSQKRQTAKEAGRTASRAFVEVKVPAFASRQSSISKSRSTSFRTDMQERSDDDDDGGFQLRPDAEHKSNGSGLVNGQTDQEAETSTQDRRVRKRAKRQASQECTLGRDLAGPAASLSKLPESTVSHDLFSSVEPAAVTTAPGADIGQGLERQANSLTKDSDGKKAKRKKSHTLDKDGKKAKLDSKRKPGHGAEDTEEPAFDDLAAVATAVQDASSGPRSSSRKNKGKGRPFADEDLGVAAKVRTQESAHEILSSPVKVVRKRKGAQAAAPIVAEEENEAEHVMPTAVISAAAEFAAENVTMIPEDKSRLTKRSKATEEEDAFADDEPSSEEEDDKEGELEKTVLTSKDANVNPQRVPSFDNREGTPVTNGKKKSSLVNVLARTGCYGARPTGLFLRAKIPRLHANLKPPPPPKPAMPKDKVRKKKGHESYSDEEKASLSDWSLVSLWKQANKSESITQKWYEVKPAEEWDSDDHRKWQRHVRRQEMGLASDDSD